MSNKEDKGWALPTVYKKEFGLLFKIDYKKYYTNQWILYNDCIRILGKNNKVIKKLDLGKITNKKNK